MIDPRDDRPVLEAHDELHPHRNPPGEALDEADHVRMLLPRRHAVDDPNRPVLGLEIGLEHERSRTVAARDSPNPAGRSEEPAPVALVPEQRREARTRVEAREAKPIDGTVASDESRRMRVPD
jgi:hypothetical protein